MSRSTSHSLLKLRDLGGFALLLAVALIASYHSLSAPAQPARGYLQTGYESRAAVLGPEDEYLQAIAAVLPANSSYALIIQIDSRATAWRAFWLQHGLAPRLVRLNQIADAAYLLLDTEHLPADLPGDFLGEQELLLSLPNGIAVYRIGDSP